MNRRPEPVFILCPARSFSTVSTALLGGHPGIYGLPELLVFGAPTVAEIIDGAGRHQNLPSSWLDSRVSGVIRTVAQLHEGDQSPEAIGRARAWLGERGDWPSKRLMEHVLDQVSPRIGLEKSPQTVGTDAALAECLAAFPGARFIHLTRHPVTTQRSMQRHWAPFYPQKPTLVATAATAWYQGHRRALRMLAEVPADQWVRVRAEDLLREPKTILPAILAWLGLAAEPEIVDGMLRTEEWTFAGRGSDGALFGGDPGFMRSPALRSVAEPEPVRFDPDWGLPDEMARRMTALAATLGYPSAEER